MSWTDERVERLSTLWLDGRSASQIAAELGEGVSRNAVIGKVHRLGLSGRAVAAGDRAAPPRHPRLPGRSPASRLTPVAAARCPAGRGAGRRPAPVVAPKPACAAQPATPSRSRSTCRSFAPPGIAIPVSDRVTILELSGSMCRWPIGDPTSAEFRFCGCRAVATLPYCQDHARVAFQPVADRRRTERMIRIA